MSYQVKDLTDNIKNIDIQETPQFGILKKHKQMYQLYDCFEKSQAIPIVIPDQTNYSFQERKVSTQKQSNNTTNNNLLGFASKFPPKKEEYIYSPLTGCQGFDEFMGILPFGSTTVYRSDNPDFVTQVCNRYIAQAIFTNPYNKKIAFIDQMGLYCPNLQQQFLGDDWDQTIKTQMNNINYSRCQNDYETLSSLVMQVRNYQKKEKDLRLIMISVNDVINFGNESCPKMPKSQQEIEDFDNFIQRMKKLEEVLQIENQKCPIVIFCQRDNNCNSQQNFYISDDQEITKMDVHTLIDATILPQWESQEIDSSNQSYLLKNTKSPSIKQDFITVKF